MTDLTAKRTLVKSPPELWAELSELESLGRHLGEFGEIRITRTDPESTVAWEGEHASGTVELEESGWGTKVTLRAAVQAEDTPAAESEPLTDEPGDEIEAQATVESPAVVLETGPAARPERRRLFGRWRRRHRDEEREAARQGLPEPVMAAAIVDGALTVVEKGHVAKRPAEPAPEPEPVAVANPPEPQGLDIERALSVLETTLDNLGQAHHRPFSRG